MILTFIHADLSHNSIPVSTETIVGNESPIVVPAAIFHLRSWIMLPFCRNVRVSQISYSKYHNTVNDLWYEQVSFKKEVGVMVNDLVFWLTVFNFENVLLTFK